jgi:dsDNA-specific endonuclease/ATPase MutS2
MITPVKIPITDELDLHSFRPNEVEALLADYFDECLKKNILSVRVIHGKGTGALKRHVHAALSRNPKVKTYSDAPPAAGGWGATMVTLLL